MSIQTGYGPLRQVYVRAPRSEDVAAWETYGWHAAPDHEAAAAEHLALRDQLAAAGAEVVLGSEPVRGDPDHIYAYDPVLMTDDGAILLRPGKEGRRAEPAACEADLTATGVPIAGRLADPATAEGGDMFFIDPTTLLIGIGYRTNEEAVAQLAGLLEPRGVTVAGFDLVHLNGPGECLHLMSFLSPLDADLAVGYPRLMPVRLLCLLRDRGIQLVEVPDEEFPTMGPNVLALGPRIALALEGNDETRRRMERAAVEVHTYRGDEISRKGDGGPTCLTRPLRRG
ncbi:MAG: dimethylarginine dimethylaminohydrolase family protein [Actinomycetota bacterium]